ncbi:hypothetical protein HPB48_019811 [Haemaphysalis longicornis]|uniref:SKP1 component POZ domain-containing protein n=1 Tax=Haemaphysalis longicornis TaxID=44386 RepID=A0A9J6GF79_HAELO|nr:hypothetical protein HPB48_019811 [Haemaphysalis longicornis]
MKLQSCDGKVFEVQVPVVRMWNTMKHVLDDVGIEKDDIVPLPSLESDVLEKVIIWTNQHKDDPPTQEDVYTANEMKQYGRYISPWDENFSAWDRRCFSSSSPRLFISTSRAYATSPAKL